MIVDAHCDTLEKWSEGNFDTDFNPKDIKEDYIQVLAAYIGDGPNYYEYTGKLINCFNNLPDTYKKCLFADDFCNLDGKIGAILSIEGGEALKGEIGNIRYFFDKGIRIFGLTWNYENEIASGAHEKDDKGLTPFGKEVIRECEDLGVTVDLSHTGEKSFYEAVYNSRRPVILSHSNSKAVMNHERNVTDKQFLALVNNGGVLGINFYPKFLSEKSSGIDDIIKHIDHFLSLGGENNIGFGTDFDGIPEKPIGVHGTKSLYDIVDRLYSLYKPEVVKKIASCNFLRVFSGNFPQKD
ncbi:MAG: dipeptidase [Bacillota bacterium]|nr:dipeptidase [Bacillota bacterium]